MTTNHAPLRPREGFNPLMVNWGGPDQTRTDTCSYCGDPFPESDDFVPLILWNDAGWCAEFCDHCQATWFGLQSFPPEPDDDPHDVVFDDEEAALELGPCCICAGKGAGAERGRLRRETNRTAPGRSAGGVQRRDSVLRGTWTIPCQSQTPPPRVSACSP